MPAPTPLIDLKALLRAQGRKRDLTLRPIATTQAQAKALQRLYAPIMQVWSDGVRDRILPAYAASMATFTGDSPADIEAEIEITEEGAVRAVFDFREFFREWAASLMRWHIDRIGSQLTYATNVELSTQLGGATETLEDALARNTALVRDISDQARGRLSDIVFRGLQQRTPTREVAKELQEALGLGKKRSLRIASDQLNKLSGALDALRGQQLGADGYLWVHSRKLHFRESHKERDGKFFAFGSEVDRNDPPGAAPFCGCVRRIEFDMTED